MELIKQNFKQLTEIICLTNGEVDVMISLDFGPRVLFYGYSGEQNFFQTFKEGILDIKGKSKEERERSGFKSFGGHRFWVAPEDEKRTYAADNHPVEYEWKDNVLTVVSAIAPVEPYARVEKILQIRLDEQGSRVRVNHRLVNHNAWPITASAWGISVMAEGGRVIIPQEEFTPHTELLTPNRSVVLWGYTKMNDPRIVWGEKYIQLIQDNKYPLPTKIGLLNRRGEAAYILSDQVFIKRHPFIENVTYPDRGCNSEYFTMPNFLEVESLSPLTKLMPLEAVSHEETWELKKGFNTIDESEQEAELDKIFS